MAYGKKRTRSKSSNFRRWKHFGKRVLATTSAGTLGYIHNNLPGAYDGAKFAWNYVGPYNRSKSIKQRGHHKIKNFVKFPKKFVVPDVPSSNRPHKQVDLGRMRHVKIPRRNHPTHKRAKKYIKKSR